MREMKNSGVEWIGEIPEEWTKDKVIRLFNVIGSGTTPKNITSDFPCVNWIQSGDINGSLISNCKNNISKSTVSQYSALKIYAAPFIVIAMYGASVGNISISLINGCVNQACCVLSTSICNLNYAFYAIKSSQNYLVRKAIGGGQPNINQDTIKQLWLPLPALPEQERIAAFLDAECAEIDAVLEKTRASIEEYKKLKQAVITQAVTKGIRGDRPMKDSGIEWIGDIPAEWDVVRQKYFWNTVESGVSVNAADKPVDNSEQYGVLKTSAVSKFVFIPTEHKQVNLEEYGRVSCPVRADSIIASRMNTPELVGACGYVQNNYPNLFLPDRLWQITFKDGLSPKYAWYYLSGIRVRQYISSLSTGTSSSMQNISQSQYGNIFITIPSIGEQSEITKYLDEKCRSVDALVTKKQQYLTEIENYKKSLIYEYVTGKKEVKTSVLAD